MSNKQPISTFLGIAAGLVLATNGAVLAGVNILEFDEETGSTGTNSNQSVGWQFDLLEQITVQALLWFDDELDGLSVAHETGIWAPDGTLLVSAVIPAGTAADLRGVWRSVPVDPVVLSPGNGYIVGGFNGSASTDRLAFNVDHTFVDPSINYVDATFSSLNGIFERPTNFSSAVTGFYGPSFQLSLGPELLILDLDIKPGSCPNPFNCNSNGLIPVALLGSVDLDVTQVDISTLQLCRKDGAGGCAAPNEGPPGPHTTIEDVATPFPGDPQDPADCCHDLEGDGIPDLVMHFPTQEVCTNLGLDVLPGGTFISLQLQGNLLDGTPFVAEDCMVKVPPGSGPAQLNVAATEPGVYIDVTPMDENVDGGGFTPFMRSWAGVTFVTLSAPKTLPQGWTFAGWTGDFTPIGPTDRPQVDVLLWSPASIEAIYNPRAGTPGRFRHSATP